MPSPSAINVQLNDDNAVFLRIATHLLQEYYCDALSVCSSGGVAEAAEQACRLKPQVLLIGLSTSNSAGLETIRCLRATMPELRIIVLGLLDTFGYHEAVVAAGADAFLLKAELNSGLLPTIRRLIHDACLDG